MGNVLKNVFSDPLSSILNKTSVIYYSDDEQYVGI